MEVREGGLGCDDLQEACSSVPIQTHTKANNRLPYPPLDLASEVRFLGSIQPCGLLMTKICPSIYPVRELRSDDPGLIGHPRTDKGWG